MGTRLPLKLLYTMLVVLAVLATTLLMLMLVFKIANLFIDPAVEHRGSARETESSPKKSRPSGALISYVAPESGLYVLGLGNGVKDRLVGDIPTTADPDWSADSRKVAFVGTGDSIWTIDADGREPHRLTGTGEPGAYGPDWSPDGEKIAFSSYSGGGSPGIQVASPDGSDRETLTESREGVGNFNPDWSPDGSRLVFMQQGSSSEMVRGIPVNEIHTIDSDGSGEKLLVSGAGYDSPSFSPDGTRIAFVGRSGGDAAIYATDDDGTRVEKLSGGAMDGTAISWSPDGERLAFTAEGAAGPEIHLLDAGGGGEQSATDPPTEGLYPTWLPRNP